MISNGIKVNNYAPKISVVIPVYNRIHSLRRCLDSVLAQTYPVVELLVVDDCSSDGSAETAESIADIRIRLLRLPVRSGAQAARNAGIRSAEGDWIAFLDSDDEWLPDKIARQVQVLAGVGNEPMTVIHTDCWRVDGRTGTRTAWHIPPVEGNGAYRRILMARSPMFQGMLTSKLALTRIGLLDEAVPAHQEWDTSIQLAKICRFYHIRDPLFIYHCEGKDTISGSRSLSINGYRYILKKFRNEIIREIGTYALDAHIRFCAVQAMNVRDFVTAEEVLASCCSRSAKTWFLKGICRLGRIGEPDLAGYISDSLYRRYTNGTGKTI